MNAKNVYEKKKKKEKKEERKKRPRKISHWDAMRD